MADTDGSHGDEDLPDVRGEPEPDWVERIRRGSEERAERLRSLLGSGPPTREAVEGEPNPGVGQAAASADRPADTPEAPA